MASLKFLEERRQSLSNQLKSWEFTCNRDKVHRINYAIDRIDSKIEEIVGL